MKPKVLFILDRMDAPALSHRQARVLKLMQHLAFRGFQLALCCLEETGADWASDMFGLALDRVPADTLQAALRAEGHIPACYQLVVLDGDGAAPALPPVPPEEGQTLLFMQANDGGPVWPGAVPGRWAATAEPSPGSGFPVPYEAFDPDAQPHQDLDATARPAALCPLEPQAENLAGLRAFLTDVWPAVFELSPRLVLRLPRGFAALGLEAPAGVEWVDIRLPSELAAHVARAALGILPAGVAAERAQKQAMFAAVGLPTLCAGAEGQGGFVPLMSYGDARAAAMLAFRLLEEESFRAARAAEALAFARESCRKQVVYGPFNQAVAIGQIAGLGQESTADAVATVPPAPSGDGGAAALPVWSLDVNGQLAVGQPHQGDVPLGSGFCPGEAEAAWSVGYSSVFRLEGGSGAGPGAVVHCELDLAAPQVARPGDQIVTLWLNGMEAAVWRVPRGVGFVTKAASLRLPADWPAVPLAIGLSVSDPACPRVEGAVADRRQLGVALRALRLRPSA